jgi:LCP family protein required for cell wall assembly
MIPQRPDSFASDGQSLPGTALSSAALPKPHKRTIGLAVFLAVVCVVATAATAFIVVKGGIRGAIGYFLPEPNLQQIFGKEKLRVLVLGIDDNWTESDELYTSGTRTDTNIAVEVDLPTKNVGVVSIPRDLWVSIPKNGYGKLNEAYADGGPERTEATLQRNFDMPAFDYYAVLNINATQAIVDAMGGIDVNVEKNMDYDDSWGHLHIHLKKGVQHLDGAQAVGYIRFRHDEEGDFGRMRRQRQVVEILVRRLKDPTIVARLPALVDVFRRNVRTDMPVSRMLDLALGLRDITPQMVHETQLPADIGWIDGQSVLFADQSAAGGIVHKYLVVGFGSQFDPSTVHVKVENGSGMPGAASAMADYLRRRGFTIVETGNAKTFNTRKTTITGADQKVAGQVAKQLPVHDPVIAIGAVDGGDVDVVVGRDYRIQ